MEEPPRRADRAEQIGEGRQKTPGRAAAVHVNLVDGLRDIEDRIPCTNFF